MPNNNLNKIHNSVKKERRDSEKNANSEERDLIGKCILKGQSGHKNVTGLHACIWKGQTFSST